MKWAERFPFVSVAIVILALGTAACSQQQKQVQPQEIRDNTACVLDGMLLKDYPGPKAQIHYSGQKEPDFFCDTVEMFSIYLQPETQRRVQAIYTQDMGKADWKQPMDNWIDAKSAFYVRGSKMTGSMGATFAAFAKKADAEAFAKTYGGQVLRFDQVTPDMVDLHGGSEKDTRM